jgi:N-acetylmuramoyl-L-alanine amidase
MSALALIALIGFLVLVITPRPGVSMGGGFFEGDARNPASPGSAYYGNAIQLALMKSNSVANGLLPIIVIDPGHGGHDEGAQGFGMLEKDIALDIALRMERKLRQYHLLAVLTRKTDVYVSLADRTAIANRYDHSVFVSIHANQCAEPTVCGVETYYASEKISPDFPWSQVSLDLTLPEPGPDMGKTLAGSIQDSITEDLPVANRGIKARGLYVVSHVQNPAVLVECGFMSNALDAHQLNSEDYREKLAASIVKGIIDYQKTQERRPDKPALEYAAYLPPVPGPADKPAVSESQAAVISSLGKPLSSGISHQHSITSRSVRRTEALLKHRSHRGNGGKKISGNAPP